MRTHCTNRIAEAMILALATATIASCARLEADIPEAKVTQKSVAFQGVPGAAQLGEVSITQSFIVNAEDLSWAKDMNAEVYAYEVELTAASGIQDFAFLHYARITLSDAAPDSTTPAVEVINYARPDNYTPAPVLDVKTTQPVNVTSIWTLKKIVVTMQLAGIFPEQAWSADVTFHLSGKVSYKL
jgi:hypothetical protein